MTDSKNYLRTFIAIELPAQLRGLILAQTELIKKETGQAVRWVGQDNLHLTIKFLGETPRGRVDAVARALGEACDTLPACEIAIDGCGCFPDERRPRVLWVGLRGGSALTGLQSAVEKALGPLGFAAEARPFSPHLTVGRVRQEVSLAEISTLKNALKTWRVGEIGKFTVSEVKLFKSELRPDGAVYDDLFTAPLGGIMTR